LKWSIRFKDMINEWVFNESWFNSIILSCLPSGLSRIMKWNSLKLCFWKTFWTIIDIILYRYICIKTLINKICICKRATNNARYSIFKWRFLHHSVSLKICIYIISGAFLDRFQGYALLLGGQGACSPWKIWFCCVLPYNTN